MNEILATVFNYLSLAAILTSSLIKGKNMKLILFLVFPANILAALTYLLQGNNNGMISCFIGGAVAIVNYFFERNEKDIPKILLVTYAVAFVSANIALWSGIETILSIVAALLFIMSLVQKNGKGFRIWFLLNAATWCTYDIICKAYDPLISHSVQIVFFIAGILIHDRKKIEK
jgi:hypothetical protein